MKKVISFLRRQLRFEKDNRTEIEDQAVIDDAREFFGTDFPNPSKKGCPSKQSLSQTIAEKRLPTEELRNHLFGCSECFSEYQAMLQHEKLTALPKNRSLLFHRTFILGSSLAVILIIFAGLYWFWNADFSPVAHEYESETKRDTGSKVETAINTAVVENAETNSAIENKSLLSQEKNGKSFNKKNDELRLEENREILLAERKVEINLNDPVWRSSENNAGQKDVRLEAKQVLLRVKLPKDNPAGVYQVFLVDEFGKILTEKKNAAAKSHTLSIKFDFRKINGGRKRLCFAPTDEIPDCVPVNIVAPK